MCQSARVLVQHCPGLSPTIRHFENRRGEGPGDEVDIWSSRGLSLYGKVTIIKSLIIPKFVYVSSLLPTPKEVIKQLKQLLFKFLWKGVDKVTHLSAINE